MTQPADIFAVGDAYERFMGRWSRQLAPAFAGFAAVGDGESLLDVGSATGALAFSVAAALPAGCVTGVDRSPGFVRYAQEQSRGTRVRFVVGDAQALAFRDAAFARTLSLLVLNFIPDRDRALAEMIRVTRPGGTVAAAVWDYGQDMQMLRTFWDEAVALDPVIASRDERHMPLCRPGELATLWRSHRLQDVDEQPLAIRMPFVSFDDYWSPFLGGQGPAGAYAASLDDAGRAALASRLRRRLSGDGDGSFTLQARAWAVTGVVPR
jgi:SAM-dependent methyltransferase